MATTAAGALGVVYEFEQDWVFRVEGPYDGDDQWVVAVESYDISTPLTERSLREWDSRSPLLKKCDLDEVSTEDPDGTAPSETSTEVSVVRSVDFDLIAPVTESKEDHILVDSGACRHVCPPDWHPEIPIQKSDAPLVLRAANGRHMKHHGYKLVKVPIPGVPGGGLCRFEITEVVRPILSAHQMTTAGHRVDYGNVDYLRHKIGVGQTWAFILPSSASRRQTILC